MDEETRLHARRGNEFVWRVDRKGDTFGLSDATFAKVEAALPANLKRIVDQMKKQYDSEYFEKLSRINRILNGKRLKKVPGYFGIERAIDRTTQAGVPASWRESMTPVLEAAGMLKDRIGGRAPIIVGDFGIDIIRRADAAATITRKAELVRTLRMVLLHPDTATAINSKYGAKMVTRLENLIADFAGNEANVDLTTTAQVVRFFKSMWSRSKTQLWIPTWFRNMGSISLLGSVMPEKLVAAGLKGSVLNRGTYKELMKYSPNFRERWNGNSHLTGFDTAASENDAGSFASLGATLKQVSSSLAAIRSLSFGEAFRRMRDVRRPWVQFLDSLTIANYFDASAGIVAYRGFLSAAPDHLKGDAKKKWAANKAWEAFAQVSNTTDVLTRTDFQREAEQGKLVAAFLPFTSDIAKKQNLVYQTGKQSKKKLAKMLTYMAAGAVWSGLISFLWAKALGDDDEEAAKSGALRVGAEFVGLVPGQTITSPLYQRLTGIYSAANVNSPIGDIFNGTIDAVVRMTEAARSDTRDVTPSMIQQAMTVLIDNTVGLPAGQYMGAFRKAIRNYSE
jgi:hypothetical protein